jgi:hypothetical protein
MAALAWHNVSEQEVCLVALAQCLLSTMAACMGVRGRVELVSSVTKASRGVVMRESGWGGRVGLGCRIGVSDSCGDRFNGATGRCASETQVSHNTHAASHDLEHQHGGSRRISMAWVCGRFSEQHDMVFLVFCADVKSRRRGGFTHQHTPVPTNSRILTHPTPTVNTHLDKTAW